MEGSTSAISTVSAALVTGLTDAATGMADVIADLLPIALGVMGAVLVVSFGIKLFKKVTGR